MSKLKLTFVLLAIVAFSACNKNKNRFPMVIEITTYKPAKNVTEQELLKASDMFNKNYCSRSAGLISRQFLKTESGYMDIFFWESKADVERVQKTFMQDEDALKFAKMIDSASFSMKNYEVIGSYNFNHKIK